MSSDHVASSTCMSVWLLVLEIRQLALLVMSSLMIDLH